MKNTRALLVLTAALLLILALFMAPLLYGTVEAQTVSNVPVAGGARLVTFADRVRIVSAAEQTIGVPQDVLQFNKSELQIAVVQGGTANSVTLKLQRTNDGRTWQDLPLGAAIATTSNSWITGTVAGAQWRLRATATNTNPVTITVISVMSP